MGKLISIRSTKEEVAYCPECGCEEFYVHTHMEDGSLEIDFLECVDCADMTRVTMATSYA